jgi:hypothetical protein
MATGCYCQQHNHHGACLLRGGCTVTQQAANCPKCGLRLFDGVPHHCLNDSPFGRQEGDPRPGVPPVFTEEELTSIFGMTPLTERARRAALEKGNVDVLHHAAALVAETTGLVGLAELLRLPASEVGRTMDVRAIRDKVSAIKRRCTAIAALCAELERRPV